ncbi:hypothetical protein F8161_18910 [Bacillus cereus]|uniref:hypothetical protein n=1 Tax=Bacillus cereus group TaxID=86661 RepID=UPI00124F19C2|nr:hypothetical protein [Bacillus cereus]KAB2458505.1 hypothetical protein F8161_18910 [Bacillus cereus]KAB2482818.1 hypothetical protein F8159_05685 [Bacillus cereus]
MEVWRPSDFETAESNWDMRKREKGISCGDLSVLADFDLLCCVFSIHREVVFVAQQYLVSSWQAMLQMITNLCGKGYYHYHLTELPINKKQKWEEIDEKIIGKYKTDKSKWQRQRAKAKGVANFYYLRWKHILLIMHTEGEITEEITYDDRFIDVRQNPIFFKISELTAFRIQKIDDKKITVFLSSNTYKGLKDLIYNVAKTKNTFRMKETFNIINGFPAYSGILEQKNQLAKYLVSQAKKHNVELKRNGLRFNTKKKTVKNFDSPPIGDDSD